MRDAIGGVVNITIIVTFLVIVSGYLAFNVNYTKAFRVKNKIITTIEQYEGNCSVIGGACDKAITDYMREIGYSTENNFSLEGYDSCRNGYCIEMVDVTTDDANMIVNENDQDKVYYKVVTVIYIDIPIINKIMPHLKVFQVTGTTKLIKPTR